MNTPTTPNSHDLVLRQRPRWNPFLEYAGLAEFSRDDDGNIKGLAFKFIAEGGSIKLSGSAPTIFESAKKSSEANHSGFSLSVATKTRLSGRGD